MAIWSFRRGLVVRVAVASAVGASSLALAAPAQATALDDVLCQVTQLVEPVPLADALTSGVGSAVVRTVNDLSWDEMEHLAEDETTWVDQCGKVFVVEHAAPGAAQTSIDPAPAGGVPGDVLDLSSRPGSNRTIYLDFDGGTHSGTRWRNGEQIVSAPYSVDADPSTLSDAERAQVYLAWRVVAEDYAPFDVNVTTRQPDASALTRTSAADPTYGMPVVITATNSVGAGCGCGGMSYVGVFGSPSANDYQPAWVFTSGSGTGGYNVGQAVSHEVGHAFGLSHDGTDHADYHPGGNGWAPIMGSSYDKRASQWSTGEYAGADNTEDDIAIIARKAPLVVDDHADGNPAATQIAVGTTTAGLIGTRADADAFTFTAGGPTTLAVAGPAGVSNLDARVTILGPLGQTLATVDAVADTASDASMAAVWSVDLPATPSTYTAVVDGTGHGDPSAPGGYSDYGSIGAYTVALAQGLVPPPSTPGTTPGTTPGAGTGTTPAAPTTIPAGAVASSTTAVTGATGASSRIDFVTTRLPTAHVGRKYRAEIRFTGPVSEARVDWRLPRGLHWRSVDDRIVISGKVSKRTTSRFTAELSGAQGSKTMKYRLVAR